MKRKVAAALGLALTVGLCAASCSPHPESSGTNTNWLEACDDSAECGDAGSCVCGLCTAACESDADCGPGVCGTALATAVQCGRGEPQRLCLLPPPPGAQQCAEYRIATGSDVSATAAPACELPGALLCQSFDAPLPEEDGTWQSGDMSAALTSCLVHEGAGALHYRANAFGYSQTRMRLAQSVSSGLLAARFYLYIPSQVVIPEYLAMFELWDEDMGSPGKISVEAKPEDRLEVQVSPDGAAHRSDSGALLRDRWMCLSLTLDVAADNGSLSLAVDGSVVIERTGVVTALGNPISIAVVEGLPSSEATGIDLTIDDLVVATELLACP